MAALGSKDQKHIASIGVPFIDAAAAAPGCNRKDSRESWQRVADAVRHKQPNNLSLDLVEERVAPAPPRLEPIVPNSGNGLKTKPFTLPQGVS